MSKEEDVEKAAQELGGLPLYAEKWCNFIQELAVMVVRTENEDGSLKGLTPYPVVETIHEDSICTKTFMPPRNVRGDICEKAKEIASDVIATVWGRGVFAVEMFLLKDGKSSAPRPGLVNTALTLGTHTSQARF